MSIGRSPLYFVLSSLLGAMLWPSAPANANDLFVRYDQAQLLRLPRPVADVIVGNPSVADVQVQGGNLLVVTGKTFGVTNVIALDAERNVIQDQRVVVQQDISRVVNLTKGGARESYTCSPTCQSTFTIGDSPTYFETIAKHNSTKTKFSAEVSDQGGASGGGGGGGGN